MDHVAILAKTRKLLGKILSGEKTIESRWYIHPRTPYRNIRPGETIYFKESGDPVTVKAKVSKTMFYDNLSKQVFEDIIKDYGSSICISKDFWQNVENKRYVSLIFLENVQKIPSFSIDKKGFGMMAAWLTVDDISRIRIPISTSSSA